MEQDERVQYFRLLLNRWVILSLLVLSSAQVTSSEVAITSKDGSQMRIISGTDVNNPVRTNQPSGSCKGNSCGPNELRETDDELNRIYARYKDNLSASDIAKLRDEQRAWIGRRNNECGISYSGPDKEKWLGHVLGSNSRTACVIRMTMSRVFELEKRIIGRSRVKFASRDKAFHGRNQHEWARGYWEWLRQYSRTNYPAADITGERCAQGQSGNVWFLSGSVGQFKTERSCTIPVGTALLIPALNVLMQASKGKSVNCSSLTNQAHAYNDSDNTVYLKIDGVDYTELALHNVTSNCFYLEDKRHDVSGNAVGAGYWAFLEPLPPGEHKVEFGGVYSDGFRQEIVYNLKVPQECTIPLGENEADIIGVGRYSGLISESIQLGDSGHEVKSSPIVVNYPHRPVVLLLSAYDPTWWKVSLTPGTELKGVILSGYHTQAVTGISRDIPLIKAVYEEKGSCPYFMAYKAGKELDKTMDRIQQITGHRLKQFVVEPKGDHFLVGSDNYNSATLISSNDYVIQDFPVKQGLPAGQLGIDALVREGKLRVATKADVSRWVDAASRKYRDLNPDLKVTTYLTVMDSYVVLKPVTLPTGMYGAHSRSFLIPEGVPIPNDPGSHNTYYFVETGKCRGPSSGCEH